MATASIDNQDQWHSGESWDPTHSYCIRWTVPTRYQDLTYIGHGAFGGVV